MTKRQKAQRGAVSVLVVITMLMLIVFGLLALTSALAFERLGRKSVLWAGEYYELDSLATEHVQLIDESLYKAEKAARDYIKNEEYLVQSNPDMDSDGQAQLAKSFGLAYTDTDKERALEGMFLRLYFYYSVKELQALSEANDFFDMTIKEPYSDAPDFLTVMSKEPVRGDVLLEFLASEGVGPGMKNISVALAVEPPIINFTFGSGGVSGGRDFDKLKRYQVLSWQEWQEELTMEDTPFWDGSFETLPDFDEMPLDAFGDFEVDDSLPDE